MLIKQVIFKKKNYDLELEILNRSSRMSNGLAHGKQYNLVQ